MEEDGEEEMSSSDWLDDENGTEETTGIPERSGEDGDDKDGKSSNRMIDRLLRLRLQIKSKANSGEISPLSIRKLDFSQESVIAAIRGLRRFPNLRELDFSGNRISKIDNIDHLKGLTYLNISCNRIVTIEGIWTLSNLKVLDLSANRIDRIPARMSSLTRMTTLKLNLNAISKLSDISRIASVGSSCGGLRHLALAGNPVSYQHGYSDSWVRRQIPSLYVLDGVPLRGIGEIERERDRALSIAQSDVETPTVLRQFTRIAGPIARVPSFVPGRTSQYIRKVEQGDKVESSLGDSRISIEMPPNRHEMLVPAPLTFTRTRPSTRTKERDRESETEPSLVSNCQISMEPPPDRFVDTLPPPLPLGLSTVIVSSKARRESVANEIEPSVGDTVRSAEQPPRTMRHLGSSSTNGTLRRVVPGVSPERHASEKSNANTYKYLPGVRPKNALTVGDLMAARVAAEEVDNARKKVHVTPRRGSPSSTKNASLQATTGLPFSCDGDEDEDDSSVDEKQTMSSSNLYGFPPGLSPPSIEKSPPTPPRRAAPSSPRTNICDASSQTPSYTSPPPKSSFVTSPSLSSSPVRSFVFSSPRTSESVSNVPMLSPVTDAMSVGSSRFVSSSPMTNNNNVNTSIMDAECRRLRDLAMSYVKRRGRYAAKNSGHANTFVATQLHRAAQTEEMSRRAAAVANDCAVFASTAEMTAAVAARTALVEQRLSLRREVCSAQSELELWRHEIRTANMAKSVADSEMQESLSRLASSERLRLEKMTAAAGAEEALAIREMRTRALEDAAIREVALAEEFGAKTKSLREEHACLTSVSEMRRALQLQREMKSALSEENAQLRSEDKELRCRAERFELHARSSREDLDAVRATYVETTESLRSSQLAFRNVEQLHARLTSEVSALVRAEANAKREFADAKVSLGDMQRALAAETAEAERESRTLVRVSDTLGACDDLSALRRAMTAARAQFAILGEKIKSRTSELRTLEDKENASRKTFDTVDADLRKITSKRDTVADALSEAKLQWRRARNATEEAEMHETELERNRRALVLRLTEMRAQLADAEAQRRDITTQRRRFESGRFEEAREAYAVAVEASESETQVSTTVRSTDESRLRQTNDELASLRNTIRRLRDSNGMLENRLAGAHVASIVRESEASSRAHAPKPDSCRERNDEISSLCEQIRRLGDSNEMLEGRLANAEGLLAEERATSLPARKKSVAPSGRRRRTRNLSALVECRSLRSELEEMRAKHARAKARWSDRRGELTSKLRTSNMSDRFHARRAVTLRREIQTLSRGESDLAKKLAVVESKFEDATSATTRQSERAVKLESRVAIAERSAYEMHGELSRSRDDRAHTETEARLRMTEIQDELSRSRDAYVRAEAESHLRKTEASMLEMDLRRARALMLEKSIEFPPSKFFTIEMRGSTDFDSAETDGRVAFDNTEDSARLALLAQVRGGYSTPSRLVFPGAPDSGDAASPRDVRERLRERLGASYGQ